jgi:hypothetical protein
MIASTDNTEGSLTEDQLSILIGVFFGDGAMRKKTHALLEINHSYAQKEYVDWLYQQFKNYVATKPKMRKSNGNRIAYRFTTKSLPVFTQFYNTFFRNHRKNIPESTMLTPLTMAVWYMDDGSRCDEDIYLNTQQFSKEEQQQLIDMLFQQHEIEATVNKDKQYWRIRIKKASVPHFMKIIAPYILPSMRYKLLL